VLLAHQTHIEQFFRVYADEHPKDLVMNDVAAGPSAARPPFVSSEVEAGGTDLNFLTFPQANRRMNLDGWLGLLEDCGILHSDETPQDAGHIGMDEATWCFIWSQDFVSDEVARADAQQQITFVGFMEALCRVVGFVRLPDKQSIAAYNSANLEELYDKVMKGVFQPEALHPGMKVDWQAEEKSVEPIEEQLDMLIRLMLCRLDRDRDFDISEEELKAGREARREKRQKKAALVMAAKLNASNTVYIAGSTEKFHKDSAQQQQPPMT